jgi:ubiquinone/menaquinone biosynthesis C-methylase UbiE
MTPVQEEVFFEIHTGLLREGPGSRQSTQRAFYSIQGLPPNPTILDIGCGPGADTLQLAELSAGKIYAIDNHRPFIERLEEAAKRRKLKNRVFPLLADMHQLSFKPESFDLLWAEGSIYIIGVEKGLVQWRQLLKKKALSPSPRFPG